MGGYRQQSPDHIRAHARWPAPSPASVIVPAAIRPAHQSIRIEEMPSAPVPAFAAASGLPTSFVRRSLPQRATPARRHRLAMHVVVSGATGRTGRLVHGLLRASRTPVKALVRSAPKGREVLGADADLLVADITDRASVSAALSGASALILLTSAVPVIQSQGPPPVFGFADGMSPEMVDYTGAVNQIDAARASGVQHIVFVGSMGSTDDDHPLNRMGNGGGILRWKRRAELYLIDSGVPYTVLNPSGLTDGAPGEREIVFGKADDIFDRFPPNDCSIPRADVARICVAALEDPNARNKGIDCASHAKNGFTPTVEFTKLFSAATAGL